MTAAANIRLIVSDVDGVWTDGKIIYAGDRTEVKEFNVRDWLAAKLAQKAGVTLALVTSRRSDAVERRARELGILEVSQGAANKLEETERLAAKLSIPFDQILYAGDDLPDLAPMARVAISAAPSDAVAEVRAIATWKLESAGGAGAFRELVERLLRERGEWDSIVRELAGGRAEASSL
jgi:3-deoxy-D-manno-octulosonate 8-phosphate phosphatase (KDO 8-P phosphatase)